MTSPPDLATLKLDDFAPHLDTVFDMQLPAGAVPLKLVKAAPAGDSGRAGGAFSLLFTTASGAWLPQAIYLRQTSDARRHGNFSGADRSRVRRQRLSGDFHLGFRMRGGGGAVVASPPLAGEANR